MISWSITRLSIASERGELEISVHARIRQWRGFTQRAEIDDGDAGPELPGDGNEDMPAA